MKAANKSILFARVTVNRQVHQWPIAAFGNDVSAKTYAAYIKMAHSNNDVATAQRLDPKTRLTEDGKLVPGIKFAVTVVPYDPSAVADLSDDDLVKDPPTE